MPVLPADPFVVPEDLFEVPNGFSTGEKRWWVLHTRPRAEKVLARQLRQRAASFFLPLHERRRRYQRRLVTTHVPLFPGYLFLLGDHEDRYQAFATNLVVNCLHVEDQERFMHDLLRVHRLIETKAPLFPEERLEPGMAAEITSGPLAGHRGTVVRRGKSLKFVIEVDFLQRGASVEIDGSMIQPL